MISSSRAAPPARRYTLKFVPAALAEWGALDGSVKANPKKLLVLAVGKREDDDVYHAALVTFRDLVAQREKK